MTNQQLEYLAYAIEILSKRANDEHRTVEARVAYMSAIDMISYAVREDIEGLMQFDY